MKKLSSKRAKVCAITSRTKQKVWDRDEGCCIICGRPGNPEAHYIPRSQGGLGVEQNIVTLCRTCHRIYDQGSKEEREEYGGIIRACLKRKYPDWNEQELKYDKWGSIWEQN